MLLMVHGAVSAQPGKHLVTVDAPAIPDKEGFAGMFAGVSHNTLIAAGGANFPGKRPWEGGAKHWYDGIFLLPAGARQWIKAYATLPVPLAYGAYGSYQDKMILAGGNNQTGHYRDVYALSVKGKEVVVESWAPLPYALANMTGAVVDDLFFVAGGSQTPEGDPVNLFLALDLKRNRWVQLPSWPGVARINAVSAGFDHRFFLFSGIQLLDTGTGKKRKVLEDGYCFIPEYRNGMLTGGSWKVITPMPRGVAAGPGPAPVFKKRYLVFPGGLDQQTAQHADPVTHPGFIPEVLAYDTRQDRWLVIDRLPKADMRLTAPAVEWNKRCWIINGEVKPGIRSNKVISFKLE